MPAGSQMLLGAVLSNTYRLERLLGVGGMSEVYQATHVRVPRGFAIKVLSHEAAQVREAVQRFRQEAEIASSLGNNHIVQVFDFNSTPDGRPYIAMELLEGEELAARLARQGRLSIAETARIVSQAADALRAVHERGIVHRDLKPQNIFLCPRDGQNDFVKILDFGISKIRDAPGGPTKTGWIFGTPNYMSPEQATGRHGDIDQRTDIFALGVIVYECLSGRLAFGAPTPVGVMYQVCHEEPPPLCSEVEGVPAELQAVIERAMAKEVTRRQSSVTQFAEEFLTACEASARVGAETTTASATLAAKRCPYCAEAIPQRVSACTYCHEDLSTVEGCSSGTNTNGASSARGSVVRARKWRGFRLWQALAALLVLSAGAIGIACLSPSIRNNLSCAAGGMMACRDLGLWKLKAGNLGEAERLFTKACQGGTKGGCVDLGYLKEKEGKVMEARILYTNACADGEMRGCLGLGSREEKIGSRIEARRLYAMACDGGELHGCDLLGYHEERSGNLIEAKRLYTKACDGGLGLGCSGLAILEEKAGNLPEARRLYTKGCDGGDMLGCINLGVLEGKAGNLAEARRLYTKGCDGGEMMGCHNLGVLEGKAGSLAGARRLYTKACDGGEMMGCASLGLLEEEAGNLAGARRLYTKACDGGVKSVCRNLDVLNRKREQPNSWPGHPGGSNTPESTPSERREPSILPTPASGVVGFAGAAVPESLCVRARAPEMGEPLTAAIKLSEKKAAKAVDISFYEQAAAKAEEATTIDPQCSEAWSLLAYLRYRCAYDICGRGDYSSAVEAETKALSLEQPPKIRAAALRNMARIAAAQLKWEEAEGLLNASLSFDSGSHDARSWLEDLSIRKNPRPEFLSAVRKVLAGEILASKDTEQLSAPEITNLLNAPLAHNGRRLNAGPVDWLYFCDGSPVGQHLRVDPNASRDPVKKGTTDFANMQVIAAARKRSRLGQLPARAAEADPPVDEKARDTDEGSPTTGADPFVDMEVPGRK